MRLTIFVALGILAATTAQAAGIKSTYTKVDLKKCTQSKKPDGQVFEGSWRCSGIAGNDIFISAADSREMAAFGKSDANNCAFKKTFNSFNSAGSTIEWRMKDAKPFAAIQRWTVSNDPAHSESMSLGSW